nr:glycoside hydrolase family 19 protein [Elizabethkingia bruuniana]
MKLSFITSISLVFLLSGQSCAQKTQSKSLQHIVDNNSSQRIARLIDAKTWNKLFPNRNNIQGKDSKHQDFYSYQAFIKAATHFPTFLNEGSVEDQKENLPLFWLTSHRKPVEDGTMLRADILHGDFIL